MRSEDKGLGWQTLWTTELGPLLSVGGPPDVWWAPLCRRELVPASLISDWEV